MSIYIIKEGEMMKDEKKRKKTCSFTLDAETISKIESLAEARRSSKSQVITDLVWGTTVLTKRPDELETLVDRQ